MGVKSDPQTRLCSHQLGVVIDQWGAKPHTPDKSNTGFMTKNGIFFQNLTEAEMGTAVWEREERKLKKNILVEP